MTTNSPSSKPDGRYGLEELDFFIPPLPQDDGPAIIRNTYTVKFNPRFGKPLYEEDQVRLAAFLKNELGLRSHYDGRFSGPCPYTHINGRCDCDFAFYVYPGTGTWYCFCSDHVGKRGGSVTSFNLLGFVPTQGDQLTWEEIASLLGRETPQEARTTCRKPDRKAVDTDVRVLVKGKPCYTRDRTSAPDNLVRSSGRRR